MTDFPVSRTLPEGEELSPANPELLSSAETVPVDWNRLAHYLQGQGLVFDPAQSIRQFAGGFANRNYMIVVDGRTVVLRRPPDGDLPPGAHDMSREHRILSRLTNALSFVPKSFHLCESRDVIGVPFQLIEYRAGIVVRGTDMSPVASHPDAPARLCEMLVTTLASLHKVDARSVGLEDLGKPEGFIARAIAGWSKRGVWWRRFKPKASSATFPVGSGASASARGMPRSCIAISSSTISF